MRMLTDEQRSQFNQELEDNLSTIDKDVALAIYALRTFPNSAERGRKYALDNAIKVLYQQVKGK
jgi:hypothetical protein